jgi:hypothetical protein
MAVSNASPGTASQGVMIEVIGDDGLVHHLGPFKNRREAEAWIAQNAPTLGSGDHAHSLLSDAQTRDRRA